MKAAIVTITHVQNYGNRLQNYALQKLIEKYDVECDTIHNDFYGSEKYRKEKIKRFIKRFLPKKYTCYDRRVDNFNKFNKSYVKWSKYRADAGNIYKGITDEYDFFIAGSDQIWNPYYNYSPFYFLQFAEYRKRNTYAASFGVETLEPEIRETYAKWLKEMSCISVRENIAVSMVEQLIGRNVVNVLDPTLMLDSSDWNELERKPHDFDCADYTVVYFLGDIPCEVQTYIDIQTKLGKKFVYIEGDSKNREHIIDLTTFAYGPCEFLWIVSHCSFMLTDSFHGTVFSILYRKRFYSFERTSNATDKKMESRLVSLLGQLRLIDRLSPRVIDAEKNVDFDEAYKELLKLRESSTKYLEMVINNYCR